MTTLDVAPLGAPFTVVQTGGDALLQRRLRALGLRRGARLSLVQRLAGGGRIVSVAGSRVALGRAVLASLTVEHSA